MIKKFFNYYWSHRVQFFKYFITGMSAFILDLSSLYLLVGQLHISKVLATLINQIILLNYVFFINKWWSFKSVGTTHRKIVRFYILAASNAAFSVFWMWFFTQVVRLDVLLHYVVKNKDFDYLIIRTINIVLAVTWNFVLYKYWVYKEDPRVNPANLALK